MQKRSHKLLAATLLENTQGFQARRFELAFLFGSFQPDCNPLTYLKGSLRAYKFRGHNYSNSQHYIYSRISRLQRRQRWTIWQYYTLGKLTHYLADAFTYPHNENYPDSISATTSMRRTCGPIWRSIWPPAPFVGRSSVRTWRTPFRSCTGSTWPAWPICARMCSSS